MPLVSVIVPAYNHERFLTQRLESILAQTFTDYEVIILDDASMDKSKEVIERYRHHPAVSHIVYNQTNSGSPFRQWRKGLELAQGDWIWIAESDDYCAPDLLEALVKQTGTCEKTVLSYCQSNEVNEGGKGWRDMRWFTNQADKQHWNEDYCREGIEEIGDYLWRINFIPNASAVLFKKAAYANAGREFETMKMCGDWLLWIGILKQGNVAFCARPLNFFRTHSASTRTHEKSRWRERLQEEYTIAKHLLIFLPAAQHKKIHRRMTGLLQSYTGTFGNKEVARFISNPSAYKAPFPFPSFLLRFFTHSIRKSVKALLAFFSSPAFRRKRQLQQNGT